NGVAERMNRTHLDIIRSNRTLPLHSGLKRSLLLFMSVIAFPPIRSLIKFPHTKHGSTKNHPSNNYVNLAVSHMPKSSMKSLSEFQKLLPAPNSVVFSDIKPNQRISIAFGTQIQIRLSNLEMSSS